MSRGFTLIETVVMIGIIGVLGVILTDTLTQIFRGQNKVITISEIKQHGQTMLDQMAKTVREAEKITCPIAVSDIPVPSDAIVVAKNKVYTRYKYQPPTATASGYIFTDNVQNCTGPQGAGAVILSNTDPAKGVSIRQADPSKQIFTRYFSPGYKDAVTIQFRMGPGEGAAKVAESQVSSSGVLFQTTVQMR